MRPIFTDWCVLCVDDLEFEMMFEVNLGGVVQTHDRPEHKWLTILGFTAIYL